MMRVLYVNETCGAGSNGRIALDLANAVQEAGGQSLIAYGNGKQLFDRSYHIGNDLDHKVHAVFSRLSGMQGYYSIMATKGLIDCISDFKPDVVHLHNLHGNYVNLKMLLNFLSDNDIGVVITLHDCWFYTGKCTHYIMSSCEKWKKECRDCPRLHLDNVNPTLFFDRTNKCFHDKQKWFLHIPRLAVVGVSKWITNEACQSFFSKREPICVYNWVDQDIFYPRTSAVVNQTKFNILFVASNFGLNKGYQEMVELSKIIPAHWQITVIGNTKLSIPNNVNHIERTYDADQLAEYYSAANVCVNVTQAETFGLVTAESICCGTPVVVYNNTASPELVGDGCGYIVDEKDGVEAILHALKEIEIIGKKPYFDACMASRIKFSKQAGIRGYFSIYDNIIREKQD